MKYTTMLSKYCKEYQKIENYELAKADNFKGWHCHHKLEIHEDYQNTRDEMKMIGIYYNRPAEELIFLLKGEHTRIHRIGMKFNEEWKLKLSNSHKGVNHKGERNSMYGKQHSVDTKRKMAEARKLYWERKRGEHV